MPEIVDRLAAVLRPRGIEVVYAADGAAAIAWLRSAIPQGATVMSGGSATLRAIGFEQAFGSGGYDYLRPKIKLECVVADRDVQTIVDTILKHARTGAVGDGKVFVLPVEDAYRVRTGEAGEDVLQAHPDAAAAVT